MLRGTALRRPSHRDAPALSRCWAPPWCFSSKKEMSVLTQRVFLGFAAGVMIAASVWSLLIPPWRWRRRPEAACFLPAGGGFVLGAHF